MSFSSTGDADKVVLEQLLVLNGGSGKYVTSTDVYRHLHENKISYSCLGYPTIIHNKIIF